jgi:adenylate kinase
MPGNRRAFLLALAFAGALTAQPADPPKDKRFVIVLIGPTGSGKTTQSEFLKSKFNIPTVGVDDLIRDNPAALAKYQRPGIDSGTPQSNPALNDLIRERLLAMDLKKGVALDGYPATKDQADHLAALVRERSWPAPIVIQFEVPDSVVRERLEKRKGPEDTPELIERRLKDYHRELDMIRDYYPEANLWKVDGTRPAADVSSTIEAILKDEMPPKR